MGRDKILIKILSGVNDKNIRFQDLRKLILHRLSQKSQK
jgi:hypothetical protein